MLKTYKENIYVKFMYVLFEYFKFLFPIHEAIFAVFKLRFQAI